MAPSGDAARFRAALGVGDGSAHLRSRRASIFGGFCDYRWPVRVFCLKGENTSPFAAPLAPTTEFDLKITVGGQELPP